MSTCRFKIVVALLAVLIFAGCEGTEREAGPNGELIPAAAQEFVDVPAPVGFKLEDAYSFSVPPSRMFLLTYVGKSDRQKVRDFYKNNMKQQGWMETCESTFGDTLFLDFVKEAEGCTVKIEGRAGRMRVTIRSRR
ncbi:MAG: hypothetical protein GXP25_20040 [Planctomycetes bacterium]|nr:hypothetical protein [Planctomycetota bacterium]